MKTTIISSIILLVGIVSCNGKTSNEQDAPKTSSKQQSAMPFKQIDLTIEEEFPKQSSYKNLRFDIDYENEKNFLRISNGSREKKFSLPTVFSGIGVKLVLFDRGDVQLLAMELEYEHSISVHFFLIKNGNIHKKSVVDMEIMSDNFSGLKYELLNTDDGALIKITEGMETKDISIQL